MDRMTDGMTIDIIIQTPSTAVHVRQGFINPRRACAAGVTVVGFVCLCVCPFNISPLERIFVLKIISHTQRATKVKKSVGFSLKLLRC